MGVAAISFAYGVLLILGMTFAVMLYFLPSVVASIRGAPDFGLIFIINLFLGGTAIGWFVALYMALRTVPPRRA